jgi:hypothetical protein
MLPTPKAALIASPLAGGAFYYFRKGDKYRHVSKSRRRSNHIKGYVLLGSFAIAVKVMQNRFRAQQGLHGYSLTHYPPIDVQGWG